ncbi:MAG: glycosyltransferase family 4 protein [Elainella sp. Prado103]|jgi:glycosyltransferase involved in cell wall biosynthesis|nr:glycosyltransferase family 4 protein [Elainella sp. Prado103]
MKIAFISYEYPPDTAFGGIATYVAQIVKVLYRRGHHVEVFCASPHCSKSQQEGGIWVHRVVSKKGLDFSECIGKVFHERHQIVQFDVVEGTEFSASARGVVKQVPDIPLVVKLHTPTFLVGKSNFVELSLAGKTRWVLGALRQGKIPNRFPKWQYDPSSDIERLHTLEADEIVTPSVSLGSKLVETWLLPPERVVHIPYPYIPSPALLEIPVATQTNVITFIGRLEIRKGILDLAKAIPIILKYCPEAKFRFVGTALPSPQRNLDMREYLEKYLKVHQNSLEFTGGVSSDCIPSLLAKTDVCVFPSRWENFPNVCLEAMAAARGVVGSDAGGMVEMLDQGRVGRLIPPHDYRAIAEAIIELLKHPGLRMQLGKAARDRILSEYNTDRIGALQEASYQRAIEYRRLAGERHFERDSTLR